MSNTDKANTAILADYADINPQHMHMLRYFECGHLPAKLREVSKTFQAVAWRVATVPDAYPPEVTAALRKLLEAKDCAVRACVGTEPADRPHKG